MKVDRWDVGRDGPLDQAALAASLERQGHMVERYVYPPGTYFSDHTHNVDKIDAVLSGTFRISTTEGSVDVGPGDAIHVPCGVVHSAEVVGDQPVVSLDAVKVQ